MSHDLLVVGGGPVGLATAIHARLAGMDVAVFEKRVLPLDKACGEGLMPQGVAALADMGIAVEPAKFRPFRGIRFVDPGAVAEGRFLRGSGMGIRRTTLIEAMVQRAAGLGVDLNYGCGVERWRDGVAGGIEARTGKGERRARWLIGADGLHSRVRRRAGLQLDAGSRRVRYGVRQHFHCSPWSPFVEVYWSDVGEAYVTPVGPDEVGVAVLWSGDGRRLDTLLHAFPGLQARLADAAPSSRPRGAGPFRQRVSRPYKGSVALVGDAAGYLDPLTGEGLTIGWLSAQALIQTLAEGASLATYAARQRHVTRDYRVATSLLLAVAARPWLRRRLIAALARTPDAFDRCVSILGGALPLRSMSLGSSARLLASLVAG